MLERPMVEGPSAVWGRLFTGIARGSALHHASVISRYVSEMVPEPSIPADGLIQCTHLQQINPARNIAQHCLPMSQTLPGSLQLFSTCSPHGVFRHSSHIVFPACAPSVLSKITTVPFYRTTHESSRHGYFPDLPECRLDASW